MRDYTITPRYDCSEEAQASRIHKAIDDKPRVVDTEKLRREVVERLRKECKRNETIQPRLQTN